MENQENLRIVFALDKYILSHFLFLSTKQKIVQIDKQLDFFVKSRQKLATVAEKMPIKY